MEKPTFLVIGAQKCGTTSLYKYLEQHPDVFMSPVKELRFFSGEAASKEAAALDGPVIRDFETYCTFFDGASEYAAAGEVSPSYLFYPGTAERIRHYLPDVKLIAILRDPVERAFSEYWHHWKMGRRLDGDFLQFVRSEDIHAEPTLSGYRDCIRRGLYYRQLKPYLRLFDREQLLILFHEDLKADAHRLMKRVYAFLGVDAGFKPETTRAHNRGIMPKKGLMHNLAKIREHLTQLAIVDEATRMEYRRRLRRRLPSQRRRPSAETRRELAPLFEEEVRALENVVNRDLSDWGVL